MSESGNEMGDEALFLLEPVAGVEKEATALMPAETGMKLAAHDDGSSTKIPKQRSYINDQASCRGGHSVGPCKSRRAAAGSDTRRHCLGCR